MSRDEDKHKFWQRAQDFAREKHKSQVDDDGNDYYSAHLFPVMSFEERIQIKNAASSWLSKNCAGEYGYDAKGRSFTRIYDKALYELFQRHNIKDFR